MKLLLSFLVIVTIVSVALAIPYPEFILEKGQSMGDGGYRRGHAFPGFGGVGDSLDPAVGMEFVGAMEFVGTNGGRRIYH